MKTRTETHVIPDETYTKTIYGCDLCDFEDEDADCVKGHYGKTHASKKETVVAGTTFYWFDSKEDAELFLEPPDDFYSPYDSSYVDWSGPGWYGRETVCSRGGCRCGSCERLTDALYALDTFIDRWRKEITEHEKSIEGCLKHIEEAQALTSKPYIAASSDQQSALSGLRHVANVIYTYLIFEGDRLVATTTSWDARNAALRLLYGNGKSEHLLVLPPNVRTDMVGSAG